MTRKSCISLFGICCFQGVVSRATILSASWSQSEWLSSKKKITCRTWDKDKLGVGTAATAPTILLVDTISSVLRVSAFGTEDRHLLVNIQSTKFPVLCLVSNTESCFQKKASGPSQSCLFLICLMSIKLNRSSVWSIFAAVKSDSSSMYSFELKVFGSRPCCCISSLVNSSSEDACSFFLSGYPEP